MFGKHVAILGNTGSGKSCTLTAILQSLFKFQYNDQHLKNAHIVIFDTMVNTRMPLILIVDIKLIHSG